MSVDILGSSNTQDSHWLQFACQFLVDDMVKTPAAKSARKPTLHTGRTLKHASDFAGLAPLGPVLARIKAKLSQGGWPDGIATPQRMFASDSFKWSKHYIQDNDPPIMFFDDVAGGDRSKISLILNKQELDVYSWSAPCQSWSSDGDQRGMDDARGKLLVNGLATIEYYLPAIAILENVSALLRHKKFEPHVKWVLKSLDNYGYVNKLGIIDSLDYVPQSRPRLYLVSIHKDRATRRNSCVPLLPSPPPRHLRAPLQTLLEPHATPCSPEFCPLPPKSKELAYENVLSAYAKANVNPFKVPLIIDSGCSASAPASEFVEWLRVLLSCPMMTLCDRADFESKFAEGEDISGAREAVELTARQLIHNIAGFKAMQEHTTGCVIIGAGQIAQFYETKIRLSSQSKHLTKKSTIDCCITWKERLLSLDGVEELIIAAEKTKSLSSFWNSIYRLQELIYRAQKPVKIHWLCHIIDDGLRSGRYKISDLSLAVLKSGPRKLSMKTYLLGVWLDSLDKFPSDLKAKLRNVLSSHATWRAQWNPIDTTGMTFSVDTTWIMAYPRFAKEIITFLEVCIYMPGATEEYIYRAGSGRSGGGARSCKACLCS